jgi:hypothetical protein
MQIAVLFGGWILIGIPVIILRRRKLRIRLREGVTGRIVTPPG